jgi:hypothetical protein
MSGDCGCFETTQADFIVLLAASHDPSGFGIEQESRKAAAFVIGPRFPSAASACGRPTLTPGCNS